MSDVTISEDHDDRLVDTGRTHRAAAVMMGVVVVVVRAQRECERAAGHPLPWPPTALRFLDTVLAWVKALSEPSAFESERACKGLGLARLGASVRDWARATATREFVPRPLQVPFMRVVVERVGAHRERERAAGRPLPWPPTELGILDGALTMVMALAGPNPFEGEKKDADTAGTPVPGAPSLPP